MRNIRPENSLKISMKLILRSAFARLKFHVMCMNVEKNFITVLNELFEPLTVT